MRRLRALAVVAALAASGTTPAAAEPSGALGAGFTCGMAAAITLGNYNVVVWGGPVIVAGNASRIRMFCTVEFGACDPVTFWGWELPPATALPPSPYFHSGDLECHPSALCTEVSWWTGGGEQRWYYDGWAREFSRDPAVPCAPVIGTAAAYAVEPAFAVIMDLLPPG